MTRAMKNSGIGWVGLVPSHWNILPNKYLMEKVKDICPVYNNDDILSLTMNGVIVRDLDAGGKMPASFDGYQRITAGNLLMCLFDIDVTPRCIGLIKQNGLTSPAYSQFRMKDGVCAEYYYYYYLMVDFTKELLHMAKNLRHSLTEDQLGAIKAPMPPLPEQRKIAKFLDSKCNSVDEIMADVQYQIDALEEYKRSVIFEAVTKGLSKDALKNSGIAWIGEIPESWRVEKLKFHLKRTEPRNPGNMQVLSLYREYGVIPKDSRDDNHNVTSDDTSKYKHVKVGNFVINKMKAWQGSVAVSGYEGIVSPAYYVYQFTDDVFVKRYFHYLLRGCYKDEFRRMSGGIREGQWDLPAEALENTLVLIPPIPEQQAIADYLDKKCAEIDSIIVDKKAQLDILDEYKKSVIYEYVTGKKEVA